MSYTDFLDYISNPANRFDIRTATMAAFLVKMEFEIDDNGSDAKCTHPALEKPLFYKSSKTKLAPFYVKQAFVACLEIEKVRLAGSTSKIEILQLDPEIDAVLDVIRSGTVVTVSFKDLPELQRKFNLSGENDKSYLSGARIFRAKYEDTIGKLCEIENTYGVTISRSEDAITFTQPDLEIERVCQRLPQYGLIDRLSAGVFEIANSISETAEDRRIEIYLLEDKGYVIKEDKGLIEVSDPRRSDDKPVLFSTLDASLISKETANNLEELNKRYQTEESPNLENIKADDVETDLIDDRQIAQTVMLPNAIIVLDLPDVSILPTLQEAILSEKVPQLPVQAEPKATKVAGPDRELEVAESIQPQAETPSPVSRVTDEKSEKSKPLNTKDSWAKIKELRKKLRGMFVDKVEGKTLDVPDIKQFLSIEIKRSPANIANYLGNGGVISMSAKKCDAVREELSVLLIALGWKDRRVETFQNTFDQLTVALTDEARKKGISFGSRPSSVDKKPDSQPG